METPTRTATAAAAVAFVIGLLESGLVSEGVILSIEDLLHLGDTAHIAGAVIAGLASLGFAAFAARRAYRFNATNTSEKTRASGVEA